ncbi:hypothetical protein QUA40_28335, partial [Microcoleus sp. Pol11C3]|uniref:hypothetical protein n=1 Tax=Microcoleus sp. Pol11C3 TaxID=3055390 RepID=UPI002FCEB2B5
VKEKILGARHPDSSPRAKNFMLFKILIHVRNFPSPGYLLLKTQDRALAVLNHPPTVPPAVLNHPPLVQRHFLTADARGLTRINCYDLSALICVHLRFH